MYIAILRVTTPVVSYSVSYYTGVRYSLSYDTSS